MSTKQIESFGLVLSGFKNNGEPIIIMTDNESSLLEVVDVEQARLLRSAGLQLWSANDVSDFNSYAYETVSELSDQYEDDEEWYEKFSKEEMIDTLREILDEE